MNSIKFNSLDELYEYLVDLTQFIEYIPIEKDLEYPLHLVMYQELENGEKLCLNLNQLSVDQLNWKIVS